MSSSSTLTDSDLSDLLSTLKSKNITTTSSDCISPETSPRRTSDIKITEDIYFQNLNLSPLLLKGLTTSGFTRPSPIQLQAIPIAKFGVDLIAQAKSGTGKTIVYCVASIEMILGDFGINGIPRVVIVVPTREIAIQVKEVLLEIGKFVQFGVGCFIGGVDIKKDRKVLREGCDIVVGTPGRLKGLMDEGVLAVDQVKLLVMDEADKLFSEDFKSQTDAIFTEMPQRIQFIAISATYPPELYDLISAYMVEPQFIMLNPEKPSLKGIKIFYKKMVEEDEKKIYKEKTSRVLEILQTVSFHQCIIFSNDHDFADNLCAKLVENQWPASSIYGSMPQDDRNRIMSDLRSFNIRILVSSDLIARGVDLDTINLVINVDVPKDHETFLHRIGRAGRFGTYGIAINLATPDEMKFLRNCCSRYDCSLMLLPDEIPEEYYIHQLQTETAKELLRKVETFKKKVIQKEEEYEKIEHPVLANRDFTVNRQQSAIHLSNEAIYDLLYDTQDSPLIEPVISQSSISENELEKRLKYFKKKLRMNSIQTIDKLLETEKWEHPSNSSTTERIRIWQKNIL